MGVLDDMLEERTDLDGLLACLDNIERAGVRITQVVYCINNWSLGGVVRLQHHGFVMTLADRGFLTLDFGRHGISWMTCGQFPAYPDGTFFVRAYDVQAEAEVIRDYCTETRPFQWVGNNCKTWSHGLLEEMEISIDQGTNMLEEQKVGSA